MRIVTFDNPHRRRHFEFFRDMSHPHFSVTAPVPIGPWVREGKARGLRFTTGMVYLLARAAAGIPEFCRRIRDQQVVEHDRLFPSFAVPTDAEVFSFCEVELSNDMDEFLRHADRQIEKMRAEPSMEDEPGRDDYLFMSSFPWVAFTAVTHPMQYHPHDSVPRITWGKLFHQGDELMLPLSVQAHHALVDGAHMGRMFQQVEAWGREPARLMDAG